jgi:hypothetical protein
MLWWTYVPTSMCKHKYENEIIQQSSTGIKVEKTKYVEIRNNPDPLTEKPKLQSEIVYHKTYLFNV